MVVRAAPITKFIWPCIMFGLVGCTVVDLSDGNGSDINTGSGSSSSSTEQVLGSNPTDNSANELNLESEPNDLFQSAQPAFVGNGAALQGTLNDHTTAADVDVWELGAASAGDTVMCDILLSQSGSVIVGLFDQNQGLFARLDASNATVTPRQLEVTLREDIDSLYLVVSSRYDNSNAVPYKIDISIDRNGSVPGVRPQVIVLDFDGASDVYVGRRGPYNVPAFDAADIYEPFDGQTDVIIEKVLAKVQEDYGNLNVTFYLDTDPNRPTSNVSTIHFGTYDPSLLGLAENIDEYNEDTVQTAIIYTDTFKLFKNLRPDVEDISQALANVTSHEAGHLLGLRHTSDSDSIMDIDATASQMLNDQWFDAFALHDSVMLTGLQDAPSLLSWTVGGWVDRPQLVKPLTQKRMVAPEDDIIIPRKYFSSTHEIDANMSY